MSWVSGDAVDAMKLMPEEDIIAKCMRVLRSMFSDVPDPTAHIVTRWSSDPMAGMCYSYVKVTGEGKSAKEDDKEVVNSIALSPASRILGAITESNKFSVHPPSC